MKMSENLKQALVSNFHDFATASCDGKPNVVQVGLVKAINDTQLLIVDIWFNKTRKNLEENPQVALAVSDMRRLEFYQLKGNAKIITKGELFNKAFEIMEEKGKIRKSKLKLFKIINLWNKKFRERMQKMTNLHRRDHRPKAVVLMEVEEIYSTVPGEKYDCQHKGSYRGFT